MTKCSSVLLAILVAFLCSASAQITPGFAPGPGVVPFGPMSPPFVSSIVYTASNYTSNIYHVTGHGQLCITIAAIAGGGDGAKYSAGAGGGGGGSGAVVIANIPKGVFNEGDLILSNVVINATRTTGAGGNIYMCFQNMSDPFNDYRCYTAYNGQSAPSYGSSTFPAGGDGGNIWTQQNDGWYQILPKQHGKQYSDGSCVPLNCINNTAASGYVSAWNGGSGGSGNPTVNAFGYNAGFYNLNTSSGVGGRGIWWPGGGGGIPCTFDPQTNITSALFGDNTYYGGNGRFEGDTVAGIHCDGVLGTGGGGGAGGWNPTADPGKGAGAQLTVTQYSC